MPLTNSEKQAAHRARKEQVFEQISLELSKSSEENRVLRQKVADLELKLATQAVSHAKKIASCEKRLLNALEKGQKQ